MKTAAKKLNNLFALLVGVGFSALLLSCTPAKRTLTGSNPAAAAVASIIPEHVMKNKKLVPKVEDLALQEILVSADTFWYDEESMPPAYQDSVSQAQGVRFNKIALYPLSHPFGGAALFDDKGFHYPFKTAVGLDKSPDVYLLHFMALPKVNGQLLSVAIQRKSGSRWNWIFPLETVFGEVVMIKAPAGMPQPYYVVEIRTRRRYQEGWDPNIYRPFTTSLELADAIEKKRSNWQQDANLQKLVNHLRTANNITTKTIEPTEKYRSAIETIKGAIDTLPEFGDNSLVAELLTGTTFKSVEGRIWKSHDNVEVYAPNATGFSIAAVNSDTGLIPVNEISCNRCHEDTGREVGDYWDWLEGYGEVWGEDQIFSWYPFDVGMVAQIGDHIPDNRTLSKEINSVGMVEQYNQSKHTSDHYIELPTRYTIKFRFR